MTSQSNTKIRLFTVEYAKTGFTVYFLITELHSEFIFGNTKLPLKVRIH